MGMSPRSPENLVNVGDIAFLLETKTHVEPVAEYIVVKKLENGVMILLMDTPSQAKDRVINYDPFHVRGKNVGTHWFINKKVYAVKVCPLKINTARAVLANVIDPIVVK